jgi:hypothetical protein
MAGEGVEEGEVRGKERQVGEGEVRGKEKQTWGDAET